MGRRWIRFIVRRKWLVVIAWCLIVVGTLPLALQVTKHLSSSGFDNPRSQAVWATNQLNNINPPASPSALLVSGISTQKAIAIGSRFGFSPSDFHALTPDHTLFLPQVTDTLAKSTALSNALTRQKATTVSTDQASVGAKVAADSSKTLGLSGILALPFLAILLLIVFGSVAAISLPLLVALAGSEVALAVVTLIETHITLSVFLTDIVSFLALGVGIDYALFISTRFRQNLDNGEDVETAVVDSMAHAGRSVFYSGIAVALAVSTLTLGGNAYWRGLALGGAIAVLCVLLATHSLLPSLMAIFGRHTHWGRVFHRKNYGFWRGIGQRVSHKPRTALLIGLVLLLPLALFGPRIQMRTPANLASMLPTTDPLRQAVSLQQKIQGSGSIAPLAVVMVFPTTVSDPATWQAVARVTDKITPLANVQKVSSATQLGLSPTTLAQLISYPRHAPASLRAALANFISPQHDPHLVVVYVTAKSGPDHASINILAHTIDRHLAQWLPAHTRAATGGLVPLLQSFNQLTSSRLPLILIAVALVALVVLAVATGSILQALLGVLLDGLVALATAGFLYLVVQTGHLGFAPAPPDSSITPLIFVLLFGLSMDYEVILLHRIQEPLQSGQPIKNAVLSGVSTTGSMITGAGMIMVVVFLALLVSPLEVMKTIAIGLTFAVLMDTWVVRTLLVPSITVLLGRFAYWPWGQRVHS